MKVVKDVHPILCIFVGGLALLLILMVIRYFFGYSPVLPDNAASVFFIYPFIFFGLALFFNCFDTIPAIILAGFLGGTVQFLMWIGGIALLPFGRWPKWSFDRWTYTPFSWNEELDKETQELQSAEDADGTIPYVLWAAIGWSILGASYVWNHLL